MTRKQIERKYNCIIDKDMGVDSGKKYYMVFDVKMNPLFSAFTLKEIDKKIRNIEQSPEIAKLEELLKGVQHGTSN